MKLHQYHCAECPDHQFYSDFRPYRDDIEPFCPNCGEYKAVTYVGEVELHPAVKGESA